MMIKMNSNFIDKINELQKIIDNSKRIVFFGGAGVSTESGIPDFRSVDGLYNQKYNYPPEMMLSHTFYEQKPEEFYKFYKDKVLPLDAEPNITHYKLVELEKSGKLDSIVTQNIDGLHQKAGSNNVFELHGSVHRNFCERCQKDFDGEYVKSCEGVPYCDRCGGKVKPDVVLYQEQLDNNTLTGAINSISRVDTLIIGGTSLVVYPAASIIRYFKGNKIVLINLEKTEYDSQANLVINEKIGETLKNIVVK